MGLVVSWSHSAYPWHSESVLAAECRLSNICHSTATTHRDVPCGVDRIIGYFLSNGYSTSGSAESPSSIAPPASYLEGPNARRNTSRPPSSNAQNTISSSALASCFHGRAPSEPVIYYVAVFPLLEITNLREHARRQRHEDTPGSYQMSWFWAGLRGVVGVVLAAGFLGSNVQPLRTMVLVVGTWRSLPIVFLSSLEVAPRRCIIAALHW